MLRQLRSFSTTLVKRDTLALLEIANGKLAPTSLSTVAAAVQLEKPVTALIVGSSASKFSEEVASIEGVSKLIIAPSADYDHYLPENLAPLIVELSKNYTHILTSGLAIGKSLLPRVGALLDLQPISDIIKVVDSNTFVRPIYAGNALATVKSLDSKILASVRSSAFQPAVTGSSAAPIETFDETFTPGRTEFVSEEIVTSSRPELGSASRVVSGGRGLKNKETFESLINPLATKLNAAIGASRGAVDLGFCDNSLQVGQTGKIVAPDLYVTVGISGAIQHLAGMKDAKLIVAIDKNPDAPIFNVADIGLVADLNEVVPELTDKL